jgi:hypothetical protein
MGGIKTATGQRYRNTNVIATVEYIKRPITIKLDRIGGVEEARRVLLKTMRVLLGGAVL